MKDVQILPALALVLLMSESSERRRLRIVALGTAGYAVLIASTLVQTGVARWTLAWSHPCWPWPALRSC